MKLLDDGLKELGIEYTNRQLKHLNQYINEIELWNKRYGLVNAIGETLVTKHILDSLTGVTHIKNLGADTLADVGSGAGLPGIPLSIMLPHMNFTLIERSGKRVRFLRNIQALLGLKNVTIIEDDLKNVTEKYDLVTFRAFKPVEPVIIRLLMNILEKGGRLVAYKGRMENINAEIEMVKGLAEVQQIIPVSVPGLDDERNLVIYSSS
jgi:16S rRNA (guanine527-N7)-methyltransferase